MYNNDPALLSHYPQLSRMPANRRDISHDPRISTLQSKNTVWVMRKIHSVAKR